MIFDPWFKEIYENTWSYGFYIWHDMYLTCLSTTGNMCGEVLGTDVTKNF